MAADDVGTAIWGATNSQYFGWETDPAGDVDGHGRAGLLAAAPTADITASDCGAVYLLAGPVTDGGVVSDVATATIRGDGTDWEAGTGVVCDVDLTGDGILDIAIGAPYADGYETDAGAVYVLSTLAW